MRILFVAYSIKADLRLFMFTRSMVQYTQSRVVLQVSDRQLTGHQPMVGERYKFRLKLESKLNKCRLYSIGACTDTYEISPLMVLQRMGLENKLSEILNSLAALGNDVSTWCALSNQLVYFSGIMFNPWRVHIISSDLPLKRHCRM